MPDLLLEADGWELAAVLSKLVVYFAMIAPVGAALTLWLGRKGQACEISEGARRHILGYMVVTALAGYAAVSLFFLLQLGEINRQGLSGMLDYDLGQILAATALGDGTRLRLAGFSLILLPALALLLPPLARLPLVNRVVAGLWLLAVALYGISFARYGHVVNLAASGKVAVVLHFMALSLWIGALYPLYFLCRSESPEVLASLMRRFGQLAWAFLAVLLSSGLVLLWQLTDRFSTLLSSSYGLTLVLKLLPVLLLLLLGAINKFRLVPGLHQAGGSLRLRRSIQLEMLLALLILLFTAVATTLTGPM